MKKSTRILALILTLLMVFSAVPMSAMADAVSSEFNFTLDDSMVTNVVRATTSVDGDTINVVSESGEQTSSMRIKFRLPDGASVAFADGADATYAAFATANVLELKNPGVGRLNLPLTLTDSQGVTKTVMLKADFGNKVRYITNCTVAQNGDTLTVASGSATAYVVFDTTGIDGAYVEVENVSRNLLERCVTVGTEAVRFYNPVYDEGYVTVNIKNGDGETVRSYDVNVVFHQGKDANGNYIVNEYTPVLQTLRAIYAVDGDTIKVTANAGVTNVYINFGRYQAETLTASLNNNFVKKTGARSWRVMNTGAVVEFDVYFDATASGGELVTRHVEVDFTNKVPDKVTGISATVEVDGNGTVKNEVSMSGETYNATVPAGVAVESDTLTLSVSEMESTGNIVADEMDMLQSYDVHVEGVSKENDVAIIVTLGEILPIGMNKGNVVLYHIENGVTNVMTQVFSLDELDAHNEFYYDPATGIVTVAMATFSEIAVAADSTTPWNGKYDYEWYNKDATSYEIANADQLAAFGAIVGGMAEGYDRDSFEGKTVKLIADINLADDEENNNPDLIFYPIGYYNSTKSYEKVSGDTVTSSVYSFEGEFDGNGHTIKNFYQNTWEMFGDYNSGYSGTPNHYDDAMGLFGYVVNGTVKNLTVDNFSSDGEFTPTGVIAAYAVNSTFENIAITNCNPRVYNTGNGGIVGIGGNSDDPDTYNLTFTNITIDNTNKITALWGSWDVACGGLVGMFRGAGHAHMTNCHVAAQIDVYNDVCGNYQYYWYRYSGMMIGTNKNMVTDEDGYTVPETTKFHAENCTVHFGDWNNYWYCELVANSLASYTHDHQFSRLDRISDVSEIYDGANWLKTGNFYVEATNTCYHIRKDAEGNLYQHEHDDEGTEIVNGNEVPVEDKRCVKLPFNQLFTGYGWGVKHIPVYNGENYAFEGITILDREVADSVEKFEQATPVVDTVNNEDVYTVSDFFTDAEITDHKLGIKVDNVQVTVSPVGEESTVSATYTANTSDWTQGTIEFNGTGTATVTITDYYFCTPTTITVTVNDPVDVEKFEKKFENENYLYRVGNANTVAVDSLFEAKEDADIDGGNVTVTVEAVEGSYASGTYISASTWTNGTIQFNGTGVVKVTITDDNYCTPTEITLEVVDAVNAITATSATSNNVVMLADSDFSSLTVSDGYTLFGNGFTLTCATDSAALDFGYAFVTLNSGTLDNVQIVCPNFDYAALYKSNLTSDENRSETTNGTTRYYNAKSGVMVSGDSQILNSRISGARAAVNISGGNAIIDNSRIELGAVANILVGAANSVTLKDVTLVQKPAASTYDNSKTLMGFSVLLVCDAEGNSAPITLEGTLVQNAWVDETDSAYVPSAGQGIITEVLSNTDYTHDLDGDGTREAVNLGFAYMPAASGGTVLTNNIDDNRTNKVAVPYDTAKVALPAGNTYVYSYKYTENESISTEFVNSPAYVPNRQGDVVTIIYSDTSEGLTTSKSFSTSGWVYELNVDLDALSGYEIDFSKLSMLVNGATVDNYTVTDADGNMVSGTVSVVAGGVIYTVKATVNGKECEALFKVTGTETTKDSPSLVASNYEAALLVGEAGSTLNKDTWHGAAPVLNGIQIRYWSVAEKQYKTINLSDYTPTTAGKQNGTNAEWTYTPDNGDFTLTIKNETAVHSGNSVYAMPVVVNSKLYFVATGSNGLVNYGNNARTIKINYYFNDNNNGTQLKFDYTWSIECADGNTAYDYSDFCNGTSKTFTIKSSNGSSCVTSDMLVTLADGSKKRVDEISYEDQLLVWNFFDGEYAQATPSILKNYGYDNYTVVTLNFADGTSVKTINGHGFFDVQNREFVLIDKYNVEEYIGHSFVTGETTISSELVSYDIREEYTECWSVLTSVYYNCFFGNMLTITPAKVSGGDTPDYLMPFTVNSDMKFDEASMTEEIETYGLYTYEDFEDYLTREEFDALNLKYFKIAVGKGYMTYEDILYLIDLHM